LFNLKINLEISDILFILGIIIMTLGIGLIFIPAAVIFLGLSLIILAFLMNPKKPDQKGGE